MQVHFKRHHDATVCILTVCIYYSIHANHSLRNQPVTATLSHAIVSLQPQCNTSSRQLQTDSVAPTGRLVTVTDTATASATAGSHCLL